MAPCFLESYFCKSFTQAQNFSGRQLLTPDLTPAMRSALPTPWLCLASCSVCITGATPQLRDQETCQVANIRRTFRASPLTPHPTLVSSDPASSLQSEEGR